MLNDLKKKEKQFNLDYNCSTNSIVIENNTITITNDGVTTTNSFFNDQHLKLILHSYIATCILHGTNPSVVCVYCNNNGIYDKKFTLYADSENNNRGVIVADNMKQTVIIEEELVTTFKYHYDYARKLILSY